MVVALGRTYHNNETLALLLLDELARSLDARHLRWGMMIDVNTLEYCRDELLGPELDQRLGQEIFVAGEPCWFPSGWSVPYIDGGDREWVRDWESEHEEYYRIQLNATIRLMRPPVLPQIPAPLRLDSSQLAPTGMRPSVL